MSGGLQLPPWEAGILIPNLPNELALVCLARVPRQHHRVLSAVSKPIRAVVSSPEFFETRSRLGFSEDVLYLGAQSPFHSASMWFTLHRREDDDALIRVPLPPLPVTHLYSSAVTSLPGKIYVCGGWIYEPDTVQVFAATSEVWVLDCRSGAWSPGPAMEARRARALATVAGGKIYVVGNHEWGEGPFAEVLDPSAPGGGRWEALPEPPGTEGKEPFGTGTDGGVVRVWVDYAELRFDTAACRWEEPAREVSMEDFRRMLNGTTVVDGTVCSYDCNSIVRFDEEAREWKGVLEEAEETRMAMRSFWLGPKLVTVDRKLLVLSAKGAGRWYGYEEKYKMLLSSMQEDESTLFEGWCTEIDVSKGRIVRSDKVFEIMPPPTDLPAMVIYMTMNPCMWDWNLFQVSI